MPEAKTQNICNTPFLVDQLRQSERKPRPARQNDSRFECHRVHSKGIFGMSGSLTLTLCLDRVKAQC